MNIISVIIPLYNRERFSCETLMSIENQVLLPEEVIIVDDHSADNSVKVVSDYSKKSALKIRVLTNQHKKGVSGATNHGIENAYNQTLKRHLKNYVRKHKLLLRISKDYGRLRYRMFWISISQRE